VPLAEERIGAITAGVASAASHIAIARAGAASTTSDAPIGIVTSIP